MAADRASRELGEIEQARAAGQPYACGLAIACNDGDVCDWLCTYTCPKYYVIQGAERISPYAGHIIRFRIVFSEDRPHKPFRLLIQPAVDFFHPLVSCDADTGKCAAVVHRVEALTTVPNLLREGLLPMWTCGDCWCKSSFESYRPDTLDIFFNDCWDCPNNTFPAPLPPHDGRAPSQAASYHHLQQLGSVKEADEDGDPIRVSLKHIEIRVITLFPPFTVHRLRKAAYETFAWEEHLHQVIMVDDPGSNCVLLEDGRHLDDYAVLRQEKLYKFVHVYCEYKESYHYARNGWNPIANQLLLKNVERFERFARSSWSAQRAASIAPLISRFSPTIPPRPFSLRPQQPPVPLASFSIANLHVAASRMRVLCGWTAFWVNTSVRLLSRLFSISKWQAQTLLLGVCRRVRGGAGVQRLVGYDPSAAPPPGTRVCSARYTREHSQ